MFTRHAVEQATEDNFTLRDIQAKMAYTAEQPEFEGRKMRGVVKIGQRYCTLIYAPSKAGITVITCFESNMTDAHEYLKMARERK